MRNIFDLENLDDLKITVKAELKTPRFHDVDRSILELFYIKSPLHINEIIVGLARKYGIEKKRKYIITRLCLLFKSGKIERIERMQGIFKIIKK